MVLLLLVGSIVVIVVRMFKRGRWQGTAQISVSIFKEEDAHPRQYDHFKYLQNRRVMGFQNASLF